MSLAADALEQRCRDAWPELPLDADTLHACVEHERLSAEAIYQPDLYLSRACLAEHPAALELFETRYLARIDDSLESLLDSADTLVEEIRARLRKLLIGKRVLATYRGHGSLQAWTNIWAVRVALELWPHRHEMRHGTQWVLTLLWPDTGNAAIDRVKRHHRQLLGELLRRAATDLLERERAVLQLHWLDNLDIDAIAGRLGLERGRVKLALVNARRGLSETSRRLLVMSGACDRATQASLDNVLRAQLELALGRDLRPLSA